MAVVELITTGLRGLRSALVSGWLWLLAIWLAAPAAAIPDRADGPGFRDLFRFGHSIGPAGLLAIASIAAYGVGSVVFEAQRGVAAWVSRRFEPTGPHPDGPLLLVDLLAIVVGGAIEKASLRLGTRGAGKLRDLIATATRDNAELLRASIEGRDGLVVEVDVVGRDYVTVRPVGSDLVPLTLPIMPTSLRVLDDFGLVRTRLAESAPATSAGVERKFAEADLRFSVAPPLFAICACLLAQLHERSTSLTAAICALAVLAIPGLLIQGWTLSARATLDLVDVLRTRSASVELEMLTPIFARYSDRARLAATALMPAHTRNPPPVKE